MRLTNFTRDALASSFKALCEGDNAPAVLKIYSGTLPTTANDGAVAENLLATLPFGATAWRVTTSADTEHGKLTLFAQLEDENIDVAGTASYAVLEDAAGNKLLDLACPAEVAVGTLEVGGRLVITILTLTLPEEC